MARILLESYVRNVASTGTPESIENAGDSKEDALSTNVIIQAKSGNTTNIEIGGRDAQHHVLVPGESITLASVFNKVSATDPYDLSEIFVKVGTNGDGVHVTRTKRVS